jgi:hypothetical protein
MRSLPDTRRGRESSRSRQRQRAAPTYRKYIFPLFPTLATVNFLPSLPAELPSGAISILTSSLDLPAGDGAALSWRALSRSCRLRTISGDSRPVPLDRGAGERRISVLLASWTSRTDVAMRCSLEGRPRGARRSRCRCRRRSGEGAPASREAGIGSSMSMLSSRSLSNVHRHYCAAESQCIGGRVWDRGGIELLDVVD